MVIWFSRCSMLQDGGILNGAADLPQLQAGSVPPPGGPREFAGIHKPGDPLFQGIDLCWVQQVVKVHDGAFGLFELLGQGCQIIKKGCGYRFSRKVPDYRSHFQMGMEGEPVVYAPDLAVGALYAMHAFAVGIIAYQVEAGNLL